jgi:hypothetical protein
MKNFTYGALIILFLVAGLVASVAWADWTPPTVAAPNGNVAPPLNTATTSQIKEGGLAISGTFRALSQMLVGGFAYDVPSGSLLLDVEGPTGASKYCDNAGDNCVSGNLRELVTAGSGIQVTQVVNGSVAQSQISLSGAPGGGGALTCGVSACEWRAADSDAGSGGVFGAWATLQYVCPSDKPVLAGVEVHGAIEPGVVSTLKPAFTILDPDPNEGNRLYCCSFSCAFDS